MLNNEEKRKLYQIVVLTQYLDNLDNIIEEKDLDNQLVKSAIENVEKSAGEDFDNDDYILYHAESSYHTQLYQSVLARMEE